MESIGIAVSVTAAAVLAYSLFGYPLLVMVWGRIFPRPVGARPVRKSVSILLPVRDGETWVRAKLESLLALDYPRDLVEIIVVSDGSRDRTAEIVAQYAGQGVRLECIEGGGKAVALNRALELAQGEILFFTDVRQPLDPDCLTRLVACFADPEVGVATGELIIRDGRTQAEARIGLYWRYEKWIRRQLNRAGSLLVVTGCVYAMRRALARPLPPGTLIDDAVLPARALLDGYRIVFEEDARAYDFPTALQAEFRRKVRTLAGLFQLARLYPRLLNPFYRWGFHFLSYKFSRLVMPYALLAALAAAPFLPPPWNFVSLGVQAGFYALAAADPLVPEGSAVKWASALARTFTTLMLASLAAAGVLFIPPERLWKQSRTRSPEG
jgi:cellulose synthase/poly-beta-1,6-N-acetylglucosamine synthase-like glycosyltransferase